VSLSWASSIQSVPPYPTSWISILILSSYLRLGLPSGLFPSICPTKTMYTPFPSPIHATCPAHLIIDLITRTILGEEYRSLSSSFCRYFHSPGTSSLLGKIHNCSTQRNISKPSLPTEGTVVALWLRYCATNHKVAGSIPDGVMEFFIDINPDRTMALGVDSPYNRNEYQEYFLAVNAAGA
jgi:hypothetical protein